MPAHFQGAQVRAPAPPTAAASLIRAVAVAAMLLPVGACRNPQADAAIYQQLNDAADQFAIIRHEMGIMQDQIDSLRSVIARQDTVVRRVANVVGFPIPPESDY